MRTQTQVAGREVLVAAFTRALRLRALRNVWFIMNHEKIVKQGKG